MLGSGALLKRILRERRSPITFDWLGLASLRRPLPPRRPSAKAFGTGIGTELGWSTSRFVAVNHEPYIVLHRCGISVPFQRRNGRVLHFESSTIPPLRRRISLKVKVRRPIPLMLPRAVIVYGLPHRVWLIGTRRHLLGK